MATITFKYQPLIIAELAFKLPGLAVPPHVSAPNGPGLHVIHLPAPQLLQGERGEVEQVGHLGFQVFLLGKYARASRLLFVDFMVRVLMEVSLFIVIGLGNDNYMRFVYYYSYINKVD